MDELTKYIQDEVPWCMLFADDIVLVEESKEKVNRKLELWRETLENKGLRLSRTKTEYMECKFDHLATSEDIEIKIGTHCIPRKKSFKYLGSIFQSDGRIDGDVTHRINAGWLKWRGASGILCDKKIPLKLKGKYYRAAIRPAMFYGSECWAVNHQHVQKMPVQK